MVRSDDDEPKTFITQIGVNNLITAIAVPIVLFLLVEVWNQRTDITQLRQDNLFHEKNDIAVQTLIDGTVQRQIEGYKTLSNLQGNDTKIEEEIRSLRDILKSAHEDMLRKNMEIEKEMEEIRSQMHRNDKSYIP